MSPKKQENYTQETYQYTCLNRIWILAVLTNMERRNLLKPKYRQIMQVVELTNDYWEEELIFFSLMYIYKTIASNKKTPGIWEGVEGHMESNWREEREGGNHIIMFSLI